MPFVDTLMILTFTINKLTISLSLALFAFLISCDINYSGVQGLRIDGVGTKRGPLNLEHLLNPLVDPIWTPSGPLLDPLQDPLLDPHLDPLFFLPENMGSDLDN